MTALATITVRNGARTITDTRPLQVPENFDDYKVCRRLLAQARKTYGPDARITVEVV